MDVAKSTCALKKKGNVEGTAFSYLLQTVEDVVLEDVRLYFLSLQDRKRENLYTLQALIFGELQLIPSEFADFDSDITRASNMIRKKYSRKHFNLELKPIKSLYMPQAGNYGRANASIQKNFLKKFNEKFIIVPFGISPTAIEIKARNYTFVEAPYAIRSWPFKNFKEQFSQHKISQWTNRGIKTMSYAPMWLSSEQAECCNAATFNPREKQIYLSKYNDRLFNLYRGLQVTPKEGDWFKIKNMILQNLCNGNGESFNHILKWAALAVQMPWKKCVTALVFQGSQGSGKGTFANTLMGSFFGKCLHYSHIVNTEHLCGKFNGIVSTPVLIVLNKCLFPENHTHASVLKSLLHDE